MTQNTLGITPNGLPVVRAARTEAIGGPDSPLSIGELGRIVLAYDRVIDALAEAGDTDALGRLLPEGVSFGTVHRSAANLGSILLNDCEFSTQPKRSEDPERTLRHELINGAAIRFAAGLTDEVARIRGLAPRTLEGARQINQRISKQTKSPVRKLARHSTVPKTVAIDTHTRSRGDGGLKARLRAPARSVLSVVSR